MPRLNVNTMKYLLEMGKDLAEMVQTHVEPYPDRVPPTIGEINRKAVRFLNILRKEEAMATKKAAKKAPAKKAPAKGKKCC